MHTKKKILRLYVEGVVYLLIGVASFQSWLSTSTMESLTDALLAQLMGMGFNQQDIITCKTTLASSGIPITVQSATEWYVNNHFLNSKHFIVFWKINIVNVLCRLLQRQQSQGTSVTNIDTPTLSLGHGGGRTNRPRPIVNDGATNIHISQQSSDDFTRPLSSGSSLQTSTHVPVKSRWAGHIMYM